MTIQMKGTNMLLGKRRLHTLHTALHNTFSSLDLLKTTKQKPHVKIQDGDMSRYELYADCNEYSLFK